LNFCAISSHKRDDIALVLGKCLEVWGLASKLYSITVDNAVSNSTACTALVGDLKRHGHFLFFAGELLHVRCVAHILNLIVWDRLKVVGKLVKRVQVAVKFIRQSPSIGCKDFKNVQLLKTLRVRHLCLLMFQLDGIPLLRCLVLP